MNDIVLGKLVSRCFDIAPFEEGRDCVQLIEVYLLIVGRFLNFVCRLNQVCQEHSSDKQARQ